jgi:hypothetical protein
MDDIEKSPTRPGRSIDLSNSEQIPLFDTTLEWALDRQRDIILDQIEARMGTPAQKLPADKFQFKSEGLQIQFDFNIDRIDTLQKLTVSAIYVASNQFKNWLNKTLKHSAS